jgi:peptidylprolyl isomerase
MRATEWTTAVACALALTLGACEEEPEPAYLPRAEDRTEGDEAREDRAARARERERARRPTRPRRQEPAPIPAPEDVSAPPADAERTASGLASRVLEPGTGSVHPGPRDGVTVHYTGWRAENGEMFDSSVARGEPTTFTLNRVIPGWTEGLQLMVEGEKRRLWIPAELAYEGRPGRPQGMLVFDVELLRIYPLDAPENVSAPPADAERSASGLSWVILEEGEGDRHPTDADRVRVHYAGWRAENGELFDTSLRRGRPATFGVDRVIDGWTEGLKRMVPGERRRFWIPAELAYGNSPNPRAPQGMLVFDVHLIEIE